MSYYAFFKGLLLLSPGADGTIDLRGRDRGVISFSSGTRRLPNLPSTHVGVSVIVDAGGSVTVANSSGSTIDTLTSGQVGTFVWNGSAWTNDVLSTGGATATDIVVADSGAYTTLTNLETITQSLLRDTQFIHVPITSFTDAAGAQLTTWADHADPNPGFTIANSEAFGIRWNNNGTQNEPVMSSFILPTGFGPEGGTGTLTMHVIASKVGATVGDATTFTIAAYEQIVGELHDAGSNIGGATSAMTGNAATKTVQHVTLAMSAFDNWTGTAPAVVTFTMTPTTGTLGTDDVIVHGVYLTYTSGQ